MIFPVTTIGNYAFSGCSGLTSITIPNGVTEIATSVFEECSGLTSITIPNGVTEIGSYAFSDCSGLTSITIPNGVTKIGGWAFQKCSGLTSVTIGSGVTNIGSNAFQLCSALTYLEILCSPTSIGSVAFSSCKNIKELVYDCDSITILFNGQKSIEKVSLKENVKYIPDNAFSGCTGLTSVNFLCSPTSIGTDIFKDCNSIRELVYNSETVTPLFAGYTSIEELTLKENIRTVEDHAFAGCTGLTSINVFCTPTTLGEDIFKDCNSIKEVTFDCEGVTALFNGFVSIEKATLKGSVNYISDNAFSGCSGLTSLTIGSNVKSIGNDAFNGCSGLKQVNRVVNDIALWCKEDPISFGNSFSNPINLTSVQLRLYSDAETEITQLVIPDGVEYIRESAFKGCSDITSITIPSSVTNIDDYAFYFSNSKEVIVEIISTTEAPMNISPNAFSDYLYNNAKLYIPFRTTKKYKACTGWMSFKNIEEMEPSYKLGDANSDQAVDVADVVAIVNYILGEPNDPFVEAAADVNGDGKIDVDDVVAVVNIILDSGQQNAREMMRALKACGFRF